MKLKNKKTGEIIIPTDYTFASYDDGIRYGHHIYYSLAELCEEWEDYEEPKGSALDLTIFTLTDFIENEPDEDKVDLEDCKQVLDKLKAWKRLKDKGFRFKCCDDYHIDYEFTDIRAWTDETEKDLDLLFGGEE